MAKKLYRLSFFFGTYSIIIGLWHCYQASLIFAQSGYQLSFVNIIKMIGAVGYLIAGIGILKNQRWAEYIFTILMIYLGYKGTQGTMDFIYRLKLGYIFSVWYEIFAGIYLSLYFLLPILAISHFILRRNWGTELGDVYKRDRSQHENR